MIILSNTNNIANGAREKNLSVSLGVFVNVGVNSTIINKYIKQIKFPMLSIGIVTFFFIKNLNMILNKKPNRMITIVCKCLLD